ncbi:hypothetical protein MNBD_GAMMA01-2040 [hydrothermal vent metagenome]|uniref:Uncharacterized protein n=1 Tax=hydrothermal vent metagenome TaxID=652676 RepID=A0A3B0W593_9ZZZZ
MYKIMLKIQIVLLITLMSFSQFAMAEKRNNVTLEEASELVRIKSKGKVLSARTTNFNGEKAHRIQVLTPAGRVKVVQIPVYQQKKHRTSDYRSERKYYTHDKSRPDKPRSSRPNRSHSATTNHKSTSQRTTKKK